MRVKRAWASTRELPPSLPRPAEGDEGLEDFFHVEGDRRAVMDVLQATNRSDSVDVAIRVTGGGPSGQAGACRMGIARALISYDSGLFTVLRDGRFLTRDSRMKERKKYGLHGARRGVQFSKR